MEALKHYIVNNKTKIIRSLILVAIFIAIFIWSNNNYNMYKYEIAKVINITDEYLKTEDGPYGREEKYFNQTITTKVKNGEYKG